MITFISPCNQPKTETTLMSLSTNVTMLIFLNSKKLT